MVTSVVEYWLVVRRWLLTIVAAAILAGAGVYLYFGGIRPSTYTSIATVMVDDATAQKAEAFMRSLATATEIAKRFPDQPVFTYRFRWWTTSGEPRRTASLFNFGITDRTPERAQALNTALLDIWLELTKPRPEYRERLLQDLDRTRGELKLATELIRQMQSEAPRQATHPMLDPVATLPALLTRRDTLAQNIARIEREIRGIGPDAILTKPNLPLVVDSDRRELLTILASGIVFVAGCGLVLLVHFMGRLSETPPS